MAFNKSGIFPPEPGCHKVYIFVAIGCIFAMFPLGMIEKQTHCTFRPARKSKGLSQSGWPGLLEIQGIDCSRGL